MSRFCSNCGVRITDDSIFCEYCGSKLERSELIQKKMSPFTGEPVRKPESRSYNDNSPPLTYQSYYRSSRSSSSQGKKWLLIGVFFIVVIAVAAVAIFVGILPITFNRIMDPYNYIGDKSFSIDGLTNTSDFKLEIDNSLGAVNIEIRNISNLIEAQVLVYARDRHTLQDANNFDTYYDTFYHVSFDSSSGSFWENPYYKYELEITISNLVTTALDVDVTTGSISVVAHETNISLLSLATTTGSITSEFQDVFFETANNLTIHTSTGSISALFSDVNYFSDEVEWKIYTHTGSIELDILQETVFNDILVNYNVDTYTGSIHFYHNLHSTIGLLMYADVATGTIHASEYSIDDHYSYKSENYNSALMRFIITMGTSTGSIHIDSFQ